MGDYRSYVSISRIGSFSGDSLSFHDKKHVNPLMAALYSLCRKLTIVSFPIVLVRKS